MRFDADLLLAEARGNWYSIASCLTPELNSAMQKIGKHVPCPVHGGSDGFRLFKDFSETGGGVCNTCGSFANGIALTKWVKGWSYVQTLEALEHHLNVGSIHFQKKEHSTPAKSESVNLGAQVTLAIALSESLHIESLKNDAIPVAKYFVNRGLDEIMGATPKSLRFHPSMPYIDSKGKYFGHYPAMLAEIRNPLNQVVSLHRTFLTLEGKKAPVPQPKKLMASTKRGITKGGAIRLYPAQKLLAVAEGIETAIAVHLATGWPVWACVSAGGLERFVVPKSVTELKIMADKDRSGAGLKAAQVLASRYAHLNVQVLYPDEPIPHNVKSIDWLDVFVSHKGASL